MNVIYHVSEHFFLTTFLDWLYIHLWLEVIVQLVAMFMLTRRFRMKEDTEASAFDNQSSSIIRLNSSTILYLREVNKYLAMVCLLREENFARQGSFILFMAFCAQSNGFRNATPARRCRNRQCGSLPLPSTREAKEASKKKPSFFCSLSDLEEV